jgi:hypothetical protein
MQNSPGFRLVKSECLPLTRELAQQFRDMEASPTERPLNESRVKHLLKKAEQGVLVPFHWSRAHLGKRVVRMNGQHSSKMLCEANGSFPENMFAHIDDYEVDNERGLAVLFRQFDDRKSGRSSSDVSNAWQMLFEPIKGVPTDIAKLGAEGITWFTKYVEGVGETKTGDDQYSMFADASTHTFLRWLGEVFSIKTPEMKRVPVVSAMHKTFEINASEARTFWAQVARGGVEYEESAPSTTLDVWLKSAREGSKREQNLKPANYYQGCIYAWNAHREGKTIKDIKFDSKKGFLKVVE